MIFDDCRQGLSASQVLLSRHATYDARTQIWSLSRSGAKVDGSWELGQFRVRLIAGTDDSCLFASSDLVSFDHYCMSLLCLLPRAADRHLASRTLIRRGPASYLRPSPRQLSHTAMLPKAPKEGKPTAVFGTKRKATESEDKPVKKPKGDFPAHKESKDEERYGIIDREFYPPEMTNARCAQYNNNELPRPIELLDNALRETASEREHTEVHQAVVHWFKCDLRTKDNKALHLASEKAKAHGE